MLKKVETILQEMKKPEPTVIITGDFNFRFIEWTRNDMNICMQLQIEAREFWISR